MMNEKKTSFHYAWVMLISISLILGLAKGAITNGSSLFLTPVSTELGIGMGNLTLYLSVGAIMTLIVLPFAGKLFEKYDVRLLLTIAIILYPFFSRSRKNEMKLCLRKMLTETKKIRQKKTFMI
ncbi:hypothetical protein [Kurthia senegalensis]|uniref:hypothetical protein n=1 Tax=Kurthia senegalensis TaxID=1033740 RepID=UPI0002F16808|nr:hypothetical protein [Kurthia senegalensis]